MSEEDINNLKEMLVDFNEYSTDYTKTRCRELEKTIENTLKEIERLNNIIKEVREKLLCYGETFDLKVHQQMQKELLEILDDEKI